MVQSYCPSYKSKPRLSAAFVIHRLMLAKSTIDWKRRLLTYLMYLMMTYGQSSHKTYTLHSRFMTATF